MYFFLSKLVKVRILSSWTVKVGELVFYKYYNQFEPATVRYVGRYLLEVLIGVELEIPVGGSDGFFRGKRYFKCKPNRGLFVRPQNIEKKLRLSEGTLCSITFI